MTHSEQLNEIAAALAKAQAVIEGASKDKLNPAFKSGSNQGSKYADLTSVWDACRKAITDNGLSVAQGAETSEDGGVSVTTKLLHSSGQWISSTLTMKPTKSDPQGVGSCITYARRYALAAMVGVAPEDDDGNAASATSGTKPEAAVATKPPAYDDWVKSLESEAKKGLAALEASFRASKPEYRDYRTGPDRVRHEAVKAAALKVAA